MSMTKTRRRVYSRSWYRRECKIDMRKRRREYNRKIRHSKITENSSVKEYKALMKLEWHTVT
jgi:hypothetical protein